MMATLTPSHIYFPRGLGWVSCSYAAWVYYGASDRPSHSVWLVPGTWTE